MNPFKVSVTGTVVLKGIDVSDEYMDTDTIINGYAESNVDILSSSLESAEVDIEADVRIDDVEVELSDIEDFDATETIENSFSHWNMDVKSAEFEVTDGPDGFDEVVDLTDRETALSVFRVLASHGYSN